MLSPNNHEGIPPKTVLITSSEPGEGKSTITTNLAIAIAQAGKNVIVVDCDLHVPMQHKIIGLSNEVGLSTVLTQQTKLEKAIQATTYPGFSVLTSGPLPVNPTKLLSSSHMKSLVQWLSQQYDIVLLDTPAFLAVADTSTLITLADGVLFVARRNYIRADVIREACQQLADLNARYPGAGD